MIKRLRVTVDGASYDVTVELPNEPGAEAGWQPATAAPAPASPAVAPPSAPSPTASAPAPAAAPGPAATTAAAAGPGEVPSPLTGRVTAIVVKAGQQVNEGDHLLTLEAMKMNTFVFAPKAGKVADVKVAVGDAVEENQALMRIE